ncbi:MAG: YeeE/YedE family protein [Deinococcales bacterium]|jgi:uncharacterized membrane protein YedE/YeeE|nr:YeeE/YedE family protein [Deinococcales bacterium]|tara:strand:- start:12999 stop:13568 length:570 start_codon:yes stop_codon:yes gene_type:complete
MEIFEFLRQPWPWYIAGPIIGLIVPLLLILDNKHFGISSNFKHLCAAIMPGDLPYFRYEWRRESWNLVFALGIVIGGFLGGILIANSDSLIVAESTRKALTTLGISVDGGLAPNTIFSWGGLFTLKGFLLMVFGGFLVGFGTRYAGGCTSGHAITGLSQIQLPSLIAVVGFFVGGLVSTHIVLPLIFAL